MDLGCVRRVAIVAAASKGLDARWREGPGRCGKFAILRTHREGTEGRRVWIQAVDRPRSFWQAVDVGNAAEVTRLWPTSKALGRVDIVLPTTAGRRLIIQRQGPWNLAIVTDQRLMSTVICPGELHDAEKQCGPIPDHHILFVKQQRRRPAAFELLARRSNRSGADPRQRVRRARNHGEQFCQVLNPNPANWTAYDLAGRWPGEPSLRPKTVFAV